MVASLGTDVGAGTGWTVYPQLSTDGHPGKRADLVYYSLHTNGGSSVSRGNNFIRTLSARLPGIDLNSLALFNLCLVVTVFLLILSLPVLAIGITILICDRNFNSAFFDQKGGGNVLIFQHLFWFFGHPEVYVLIAPAFGLVTNGCMLVKGIKNLRSPKAIILAILSIGFIGCLVWAHHIFGVGLDLDSRAYFRGATMVIALPTGIKVFTWLFNLFGLVIIRFGSVFLWVIGFVFIFRVGGCSGVILSNATLDLFLHDSYYVVAHFHYVLSMGAVFGIFLGVFI